MTQLYYNPFIRVNEHSIPKLIEAGKPFVVIQRFSWPGVPVKTGFIISAYEEEYKAREHESELSPNEGKFQNLLLATELTKVMELVQTGSGFSVFYNGTIDRKNEKRLEKAYGKQVHAYIKYIRLPKAEEYSVRIYVEYGRVMAEISSGSHGHVVLFSKIIT